MIEKVLIADGDKCTGCRVCELVCSMVRSGEYNPRKSCIRVLRNTELDVSIPVIETSVTLVASALSGASQQQ